MYIYIYTCTHAHTHTHTSAYTPTCISIPIYIYTYTCTHTHMHVQMPGDRIVQHRQRRCEWFFLQNLCWHAAASWLAKRTWNVSYVAELANRQARSDVSASVAYGKVSEDNTDNIVFVCLPACPYSVRIHMFVFVFVWLYVCLSVSMYIHVSMHVCIYVGCMYELSHTHTPRRMYIWMDGLQACLYACMHVCMSILSVGIYA